MADESGNCAQPPPIEMRVQTSIEPPAQRTRTPRDIILAAVGVVFDTFNGLLRENERLKNEVEDVRNKVVEWSECALEWKAYADHMETDIKAHLRVVLQLQRDPVINTNDARQRVLSDARAKYEECGDYEHLQYYKNLVECLETSLQWQIDKLESKESRIKQLEEELKLEKKKNCSNAGV